MLRLIHCWWCGKLAEVDSERDTSGGMIRDTETSWLCDDFNAQACAARAFDAMKAGETRKQQHDHSQCRIESA